MKQGDGLILILFNTILKTAMNLHDQGTIFIKNTQILEYENDFYLVGL